MDRLLSFLEAAAVRASDASGDRSAPYEALEARSSLDSLDANCLQMISLRWRILRPLGCHDKRNVTLVRLAKVSRRLRDTLQPLLELDFRRHRLRKKSLTQMAQRLGAQGSWNHQLKLVREAAYAYQQGVQCQGGCGLPFKKSRLIQLLDDDGVDERQSKLICASCTRHRYQSGLPHELTKQLPHAILKETDVPFCTRVELTDDYGEGGESAAALREALCVSGYGFGGEFRDSGSPLCDADCHVLCDMIVSGLGKRCMWIDLSNSAVGDAGMAVLALGLPACLSLLHLNLNGNPAGDLGVAALAVALTPTPLRALSPAARCLLPPLGAGDEYRSATCWCDDAPAQVAAAPCQQLRWLYLVLDVLGDAGAIALARALNRNAVSKLECLWCCGAFSEASEPGAAGPGFAALTQACEAREHLGLSLELEHGLVWGM